MRKLAGVTVFAHHVRRMQEVKGLDGIFLATSVDPGNKALIEEAEKLGCGWYAGAEQDIVDRHEKLCEREGADAFIRVTCDCPLFDIESASRYVSIFKREYHDYIYVSNMTIIQGTLSELVSYNAIREIHKHYRGAAITMHIKENMNKFKTRGVEIDADLCRPEYRLTLDEASDLELLQQIYEALYKGAPLDLSEVYVWLDDNPEIARLNAHINIKGCNLLGANLMERPLYSIIASGGRHVILDEQKRVVGPEKFMSRFLEMFPDLKSGGN